MKRIIATTVVALATVSFSAAAMAKAHSQPADRAQMGGQEVADESAQNADARGLPAPTGDGVKGVVGSDNAQAQKTKDTPPTGDSTAGSTR
jgi:hypothetical protein